MSSCQLGGPDGRSARRFPGFVSHTPPLPLPPRTTLFTHSSSSHFGLIIPDMSGQLLFLQGSSCIPHHCCSRTTKGHLSFLYVTRSTLIIGVDKNSIAFLFQGCFEEIAFVSTSCELQSDSSECVSVFFLVCVCQEISAAIPIQRG